MEYTSENTGSSISSARARFADSVMLKMAILGLVFISAGPILQDGVWAAILPIWGAALFTIGIVVYTLVWLTYK